MRRRSRRLWIAVGSIVGLVLLLALALLFVARSPWLREQVRERIITEAERATGGRVEIGSFDFDWHSLTARINGFVIHGTEPPGSPPLLRVRSVTVVLKIVSLLRRMVDVESVDADQPQTYLLIQPDGTTNIPQPRVPSTSKKTPVETILDLAIRRFTVQNGTFEVNSKKNPWSAAGENFRAQFTYNRRAPGYHGDISVEPLHFQVDKDLPVDLAVKVSLGLEKNKLSVTSASLDTSRSHAELSGAVENFASPECRLDYNVRLSLDELLRTLRFHSRQQGVVLIRGAASLRDFGHYLLTGSLHAGPLSFGDGGFQLHDVRAESAFRVDPEKIALNGIRVLAPEGNFNGRAQIEKFDRFRLEGEASQFDLRRLAEPFTPRPLPWDGLLSGPLEVSGLLSDLNRGRFDARARLSISPAPDSLPMRGSVDASYSGFRGTLLLGKSFVQLPSTRVDFDGALQRQLRVRLESKDLDELLPALKMASNSAPPTLPLKLQNGSAVFDGIVTGNLSSPRFAGQIALTNFIYSQEKIDSFAASIALQKSSLSVQKGTLTRGNLHAQFAGNAALRDWKPENAGAITATASVRGAEIHDLLALAGKKDFPAAGALAASVQVSGTMGAPLIKADVTVNKGSFYGEPFDGLIAHVDYATPLVTVASAKLTSGARQLNFKATYAHAPADFESGHLTFEADSNSMALNQFHFIQQYQSSVAGNIRVTAKGSAAVAKSRGQAAFQLTALNADVSGQSVEIDHKAVGNVHLTASTEGAMLTAHLESVIANSAIRGDGQWRLADDYPGSAQFTFTKLDLAALQSWLARPASSVQLTGSVEGKATISGPAFKPDAWAAALEIPQLELSPLPGDIAGGNRRAITLRNQGPIRLSMQNGVIRVESARLNAQDTDVAITGTISLKEKNPLDVRVNGNLNLTILENFNPDVVSSGKLIADATVRGPLTQPSITGRAQLQNANLNLASFPNGISNANGSVLFSGDRATIENLTGESGGGKVSVTGFASYAAGDTDFRFELTANEMRVRYPEGVSTVADAKLNWTGTMRRSLVSGTVTILRSGFNTRTDFGSILAKSAEPVRTPASRTGFLAGLNFDIQMDTSPNVQVQAALAQQIQAEASLRLRGTVSNPALLGRVNITQGEMTFFGNKYTINQGSISFFNPVKVEPILNIDLQTRARGIDVTLTISGPMNKLNVSYRSDPPMQFSDIVALLATGRTPSSDLSLAARQSGAAQSWQQMGASALVGQAIANPVAGRLQRFFGVSRIKIDPQLTGVENPQARLTLEQQITPDITFTYITNVTRSNPQVIRVEWALNRRWSVVALRDETGIFGLDFYYKRRF